MVQIHSFLLCASYLQLRLALLSSLAIVVGRIRSEGVSTHVRVPRQQMLGSDKTNRTVKTRLRRAIYRAKAPKSAEANKQTTSKASSTHVLFEFEIIYRSLPHSRTYLFAVIFVL